MILLIIRINGLKLMVKNEKCSTNNQRMITIQGSLTRTFLKFMILQSNCNIINVHLEKYYNFDSDKKYKYYNPNLIRNNGLISKNQQIHCNFLSSICKSIKLLDISIFSVDNGSTYSVIQL